MKPTQLVRKVIRRVNKYSTLLLGYLPANQKNRPIGVKPLLPIDDTIEYIELAPPYVSTLNISKELVDDCSYYCKPQMVVQIPGDYIAILKDGRVYSHDPSNTAIISKDNYLVNELSFQWAPTGPTGESLLGGKSNKVFELRGLTKPKKYKGTVFSLLAGGGAKYYFYHWMMDSIGKLGLLQRAGKLDKVDYFLVPSYNLRYHKDTLAHFGITEDKVICEDSAPHIQADYLMVGSYTTIEFHHPKWMCDFLHNSFTTPNANNKRDKLIYIPRGDAGVNRKVLNEAELIEVLKGYGFESLSLSQMSVVEGAKHFNSARLVLGAHGSGFTNLVFCEPGTIVVEIFPDKYVRHINSDICDKMGLEYHYLLCPADRDATDTISGQLMNVTVDIPAVKAKLDKLLK